MALWDLSKGSIKAVAPTTFSDAGVHERRDLQSALRANAEAIAPDTLVLGEEYSEWEDSRRRIDLLGLDKAARLVVIELKRTEDGGHMDLQALRYAAMVSTMTFEKAVEVYAAHLAKLGRQGEDAQAGILDFLGWDEPQEDDFATDVRIVLASAEFSKEITSTVLWLREHDVDIRCVRLAPYRIEGRLVLDVQQIIPLPEAAEYQVRVREKVEEIRRAREFSLDSTRYDLIIGDTTHTSLAKRTLLLALVKAAVASGVTPEELRELLPAGRERFLSVPGDVSSEEFLEAIKSFRTPRGSTYEPRRYFTGAEDLLRVGGRTYAFSNQWGSSGWKAAVEAIIGAYPRLNASYRESGKRIG